MPYFQKHPCSCINWPTWSALAVFSISPSSMLSYLSALTASPTSSDQSLQLVALRKGWRALHHQWWSIIQQLQINTFDNTCCWSPWGRSRDPPTIWKLHITIYFVNSSVSHWGRKPSTSLQPTLWGKDGEPTNDVQQAWDLCCTTIPTARHRRPPSCFGHPHHPDPPLQPQPHQHLTNPNQHIASQTSLTSLHQVPDVYQQPTQRQTVDAKRWLASKPPGLNLSTWYTFTSLILSSYPVLFF